MGFRRNAHMQLLEDVRDLVSRPGNIQNVSVRLRRIRMHLRSAPTALVGRQGLTLQSMRRAHEDAIRLGVGYVDDAQVADRLGLTESDAPPWAPGRSSPGLSRTCSTAESVTFWPQICGRPVRESR